MDFAAKLRDVEQQISRVTGVVQLHGAQCGDGGASGALQALEEEEADTETEDEFENNHEDSVKIEDPQVKSEILDLPDNNEAVKSSVILGVGTQEMKMEVNSTGLQDADSRKADESATSTPKDSSQVQQVVADGDGRFLSFNTGFLKYTIFAHYAKKRRKAKNGRMDAEVVLSGMSSQDIDKWRQFVREYAPCAHFKVLAYLRNGKVARKQIELFSDATMLAVSLLITRDKCRDRYWLLQFAEELSDILHAAIVPPVVQMLGHVETSHIELVEYCISNFDDSLEDMSEYARLRHDANIRTPRTETQWARFHEIGVILAKWIDDVSTIDIPLEVINASTPTERLQRFNEQFPDRIPEAFLVSWRCVSSAEQKMIGFKQGVQPANVAGTREGEIVLQASLPPPAWLDTLSETLKKFDTQFPGKLPEALLQLRTHFEESAGTTAPECKSSRQIVTKIKRIKTSDMPVVISAATRWKMTKYLEKAREVEQRWG
ncbi:hypothetical protein PR001_g16579 [Phytophthora rubi]|uniref:Uncharacterized protein n=1 Tax=Phytophthora rubi TaxID=129364 RepID=A0A6A3KP06_9STRA|nr:hypothetical protein PR001_g16579 [Phytophthora rubi]